MLQTIRSKFSGSNHAIASVSILNVLFEALGR